VTRKRIGLLPGLPIKDEKDKMAKKGTGTFLNQKSSQSLFSNSSLLITPHLLRN